MRREVRNALRASRHALMGMSLKGRMSSMSRFMSFSLSEKPTYETCQPRVTVRRVIKCSMIARSRKTKFITERTNSLEIPEGTLYFFHYSSM